jgi:hypothetical protein
MIPNRRDFKFKLSRAAARPFVGGSRQRRPQPPGSESVRPCSPAPEAATDDGSEPESTQQASHRHRQGP